jgi:hypothetical protein
VINMIPAVIRCELDKCIRTAPSYRVTRILASPGVGNKFEHTEVQ